jgi:Xaa-Pro aminopeptidase
MRLRRSITAVLLAFLPWAWAASAITGEEFAARRGSVLAALDSSSIMVLRAAELRMRSNDVEYRFRQESSFLYLTGLHETGLTLLLSQAGVEVGGERMRAVLFAPAPSVARFAGESAGMAVLDGAKFQEVFRSALAGKKTLYLSAPDMKFVNDWVNGKPVFLDRDVRKELEGKFPGLKVKGAAALIGPMRGVKSPAEVAMIREAIRLTGEGLQRAAEVCAPGRYEYELQAEIEYAMLKSGSVGPAFPSIVGSGPNSLEYHYSLNRRKMEKGDLVVLDVGAEWEGYSADVTRTFPVSGEFTSEQRKMYEAVLKAQEAAIAIIRPGLPMGELDRVAKETLAREGFAGYLKHGVSHHLGLDTHDAGPMDTLRAGMVITVEPGAYVAADDTVLGPGYRGQGVRIEDDVLVTAAGHEILSSAIPKKAEEVHAMLRKRR